MIINIKTGEEVQEKPERKDPIKTLFAEIKKQIPVTIEGDYMEISDGDISAEEREKIKVKFKNG